jgi:hypothetical protein
VTKWFVFGFFLSEIWFVFLPFGLFLEILVCWTENKRCKNPSVVAVQFLHCVDQRDQHFVKEIAQFCQKLSNMEHSKEIFSHRNFWSKFDNFTTKSSSMQPRAFLGEFWAIFLKTIVHKWQNFALIRSHWC